MNENERENMSRVKKKGSVSKESTTSEKLPTITHLEQKEEEEKGKVTSKQQKRLLPPLPASPPQSKHPTKHFEHNFDQRLLKKTQRGWSPRNKKTVGEKEEEK